MSEKPNERIKLVVCNEPQNCGTVKELESRLVEAEISSLMWREFKACYPAWSDKILKKFLIDCIYAHETELPEANTKIRATSELVKKIPTIEQTVTEKAKELGIKEKHLAPDGMAETKYCELIQAWIKELETALGVSEEAKPE